MFPGRADAFNYEAVVQMDFQELRHRCLNKEGRLIIWLTGDMAVGKSYWAGCLSYFLVKSGIRSTVIYKDNFLLDRDFRVKTGKVYDRQLIGQLQQLHSLKKLKYPIYNYRTGKRTGVIDVPLEDVVIVEGSVLQKSTFHNSVDIVLYVEAHPLLKFFRLFSRDKHEKGYTLMHVIKKFKASRQRHTELICPIKQRATMIIKNNFRITYPQLVNNEHVKYRSRDTNLMHIPEELYLLTEEAETCDKQNIYGIIKKVISLLPDRYKKLISDATVIARGTLARDELRPASDWDLSVIFPALTDRNKEAAEMFFRYIAFIKPNSTNTGGIIDLEHLDNPCWDMQEILNCGILTTDFIVGDRKLYSSFRHIIKKRNSCKVHAKRVINQFYLRDKLFPKHDKKNSKGGIRDIHQLVWTYQVAFNRMNKNTAEVLNELSEKRLITSAEAKMMIYLLKKFSGHKTVMALWHFWRLPLHLVCLRAVNKISRHLDANYATYNTA